MMSPPVTPVGFRKDVVGKHIFAKADGYLPRNAVKNLFLIHPKFAIPTKSPCANPYVYLNNTNSVQHYNYRVAYFCMPGRHT